MQSLRAGWGAAALKGCDFVVRRCPCLMEAWLLLSSCCDNAKCPVYECAKRAFAHCQRRPPTHTVKTHHHNKPQVSLQFPHKQAHKAPFTYKTQRLALVWKAVACMCWTGKLSCPIPCPPGEHILFQTETLMLRLPK